MDKHILLEKAYKYSLPRSCPTPVGCTYNIAKGYWIDDSTGQAMMLCNPSETQTKKCDRETGEDQKGE